MVVAAEASTEEVVEAVVASTEADLPEVMEMMADASQTSKPALEIGPAPIRHVATTTLPGEATATSATPRNQAAVVTWEVAAMPDFLEAEEEASAEGDAAEIARTAVSEAAVTAASAPVEVTAVTAAAAATGSALAAAAVMTNTDPDPEEDGLVPAAARCEAAAAEALEAVVAEETDTDRTDLICHFKNSPLKTGKSKKKKETH